MYDYRGLAECGIDVRSQLIERLDRAEQERAALQEENDIQRQSIQELSGQVVEYQRVLQDALPKLYGMVQSGLKKECRACYEWNGKHDPKCPVGRAERLLQSPAPEADPPKGASITTSAARWEAMRKVVEAARLYVIANIRGTWDDRRTLYSELKEALAALEGVSGDGNMG